MKTPVRGQSGMGLVEVLVAMSLSLVVIGAVVQLFLGSKESYRIQEALSRIQENGRYAMRTLAADVRQARYLGQLYSYWDVSEASGATALPAAVSGECFTKATQTYRWLTPFSTAVNHDASASTPDVTAPSLSGANDGIGIFSDCVSSANLQANTDVLSLHFADSKTVDAASLVANGTYVKSDINHAVVFRCSSAGAGCAPGGSWDSATVSIAPLIAEVFWVRECTEPGVDGACGTSDDLDQPNFPALVRTRLESSGSVSTDVIAEGVINMQIQYGADPNNSGFATIIQDANDIGSVATAANWPAWHRVRSVRIWLLVRSAVREPGYAGPTAFDMGDHTGGSAIAAAAGHRHQVFTSTIALRNYAG